ncbi:MAG TPA: hypothetical protein PK122_04115 [Candidatus Paceibacterota bacterium]|jgi:hypothetical protein|nr:hypothetical protein [Candidatus Paceibacterota bacterium]
MRKAIAKKPEFRDEELDQFGGWLYFDPEEESKRKEEWEKSNPPKNNSENEE